MPDREKVMSWLEGLSEDESMMFHSFSEVGNIARSALELLKEQDYRSWLMDMFHKYGRDDLIALLVLNGEENLLADVLKEQEAVKPEREHSGSGVTWWNVCGNCKTAINPNDKFCHECGRPVLWEGR